MAGTKKKKPHDPAFRSLALVKGEASSAPASWDKESRSVRLTLATENPVDIWDWEHGRVPEVLLMAGCLLPKSGQLPLADTHDLGTVKNVLGSLRDLTIKGKNLEATAYLASTPDGADAATKIEEGHITDVSVGYRRHDKTFVPEGTKAVIGGRSYTGPVLVVTSWSPYEGSLCPIGADEAAKMRSYTGADEPEPEKPEPKGQRQMNKKLLELLQKHGLKANATDAEARAFLADIIGGKREADLSDDEQELVDTEAVRMAAQDKVRAAQGIVEKEERDRCTEIYQMGRRFGFEDKADEMVTRGVALADARAQMLELVHARGASSGVVGSVSFGLEDKDKFRTAAEEGLLIRAGLMDPAKAKYGTELAGRRLTDVARTACRFAGISDGGDEMTMLGRALTTSDLPNILTNVASKALVMGFEAGVETFDVWADTTGSLPDFKAATLAKISDAPNLEAVKENGEIAYGKLSDEKETAQIGAYAVITGLTRTLLINDDLGALTGLQFAQGEAAKRLIGDKVYAALGATMNDGAALFHANHANLLTGAALSADSISAAIAAMKKQTRPGSLSKVNERPVYFLAPVALEGKAEAFFGSTMSPTVVTIGNNEAAVGQGAANIYGGGYFTRVYDTRLDDVSLTAYIFAGRKGKTIKVFFLQGQKTPRLETRNGWAIDGAEFKVSLDVAAVPVDYRYLAKNPGA